nr:DUF2961 domain-containing protein [Paenibacillus phyllosphaerae]
MWGAVGSDPKPFVHATACRAEKLEIAPGDSAIVLEQSGQGSVVSILAELAPASEHGLRQLWIRATWDDHQTPDVECPIGIFFGNELGLNAVGVLSHGRLASGQFYCYFPMPYWKQARIELINRGDDSVSLPYWETHITTDYNAAFEEGKTGYFRASPYYPPQATHASDSIIGRLTGSGHLVAGTITGVTREPGVISCEGDVRVYIDGNGTPQVESDGSESWVCYGWGFPTPPEMNPASAYDGLPDNPWSMVRMCAGDWYPFRTELVFGIESGEFNNQYIRHSGLLFYYGIDAPGMALTDELDIGNRASEGIHRYRSSGSRGCYTLASYYEGREDQLLVQDVGHETEGWSEFVISVDPDNRGVRLRRRSDQITGRQRARVYVDGMLVEERDWYAADRNPYKRWLEDEFDIPPQYTAGKRDLVIRLAYVPCGETRAWNEFYYWVYSIR